MAEVATFPFLSIHLHTAASPVLEMEWKGFVSSADFRQALATGLALARRHHVTGWLANDRRLGALRPRDVDWSFAYLHTALAEQGLRRFALLETEETLNRFIIGNKYDAATPALSFEFRRFTNLEEARAWAGL